MPLTYPISSINYFTPSGLGYRITKRSTLSLCHPFGVGISDYQTIYPIIISPLRGWDGGLPNDLPYHYVTPSGLGWRITKRSTLSLCHPFGVGMADYQTIHLSLFHPFGVGMADYQTIYPIIISPLRGWDGGRPNLSLFHPFGVVGVGIILERIACTTPQELVSQIKVSSKARRAGIMIGKRIVIVSKPRRGDIMRRTEIVSNPEGVIFQSSLSNT